MLMQQVPSQDEQEDHLNRACFVCRLLSTRDVIKLFKL
jgi:hypothetical protein